MCYEGGRKDEIIGKLWRQKLNEQRKTKMEQQYFKERGEEEFNDDDEHGHDHKQCFFQHH